MKIALGLLGLLPALSWAEVSVNQQGMLETRACSYGRGQVAVTGARDLAAAELAEFIQGAKVLDNMQGEEHLDVSAMEFYQSQRRYLVQGLQSGAMPLHVSSAQIEGNDTCVTVALALNYDSDSEPVWDEDAPSVTVTVEGEGWPQNGMTARQQAEQDAFARAVSQVAGVLLNQQRSHASMLSMTLTNSQESDSLTELVGQQLQSRSVGMISEWELLASKELADGGLHITIMAVVDKAPLVAQVDDLLAAVGSPRVALQAPALLQQEIGFWLTSQGIEVAERAPLMLRAESIVVNDGNNRRLEISLQLTDFVGNVYGRWHNQPHLLSLPATPQVESALTQAHLASETQLQSLSAALQAGFERVVAQGGVMRQLHLPIRLLSQPQKLQSLLTALGGVKDVSVSRQKNLLVASLRYQGAATDLASQVDQMLRVSIGREIPDIEIQDDYILIYR